MYPRHYAVEFDLWCSVQSRHLQQVRALPLLYQTSRAELTEAEMYLFQIDGNV
ncbi:hypothetical protein D3C75_1244400 [compost metagenome]